MRLSSPAAERNAEPIAGVLERVLPVGLILELASGTGQHAAFFAGRFADRTWQPSDPDPRSRASIQAWRDEVQLANLLPPLPIDATESTWPIDRADAVVNINMIHISPWQACLGLLDGAARLLEPGRPLVIYGPHLIRDRETAASNLAFDRSLRLRNPAWGIRWLHEVEAAAAARGFDLAEVVDMPANNITAIYRRR